MYSKYCNNSFIEGYEDHLYEGTRKTNEELEKYHIFWSAVIMQGYIDAKSNYKRTEYRIAKRQAFEWFYSKSNDFSLVCKLAGYHPNYIYSLVEPKLCQFQATAEETKPQSCKYKTTEDIRLNIPTNQQHKQFKRSRVSAKL